MYATLSSFQLAPSLFGPGSCEAYDTMGGQA